jgi:hypothetical protein
VPGRSKPWPRSGRNRHRVSDVSGWGLPNGERRMAHLLLPALGIIAFNSVVVALGIIYAIKNDRL